MPKSKAHQDFVDIQSSPEWPTMTPDQKEIALQQWTRGEPVDTADVASQRIAPTIDIKSMRSPEMLGKRFLNWVEEGEEARMSGAEEIWEGENSLENRIEKAKFYLEEGRLQGAKKIEDKFAAVPASERGVMSAMKAGLSGAAEALPDYLGGAARALLPEGEAADVLAAAPDPGDAPPEPGEEKIDAIGLANNLGDIDRALGAYTIESSPEVRARTANMRRMAAQIRAIRSKSGEASREKLFHLEAAYLEEQSELDKATDKAKERMDAEAARLEVEQKHLQRTNKRQVEIKDKYDRLRAAKQVQIEDWKSKHGELNMSDAIMQKSPLGVAFAVLSGLGQTIGAAGATLGGTENFAAKLVENSLQARLHAMKEKISESRRAGGDLRNEYNELRELMGDEQSADLAFQMRDLDAILKGVDAQIGKLRSQEEIHNMKAHRESVAGLRREKAIQLENRIAGTEMQGLQAEGTLHGQIMNAELQADKASAQMALNLRKMLREKVRGGKPLSEKTIELLSGLQAAEIDARGLAQQFEKVGWEGVIAQFIPGTEARDYRSKSEAAAVQIIKSLSGAQVTDKEREYIIGLIPSALTPKATARQRFAELIRFARTKRLRMIQNLEASGRDVSGILSGEQGRQFQSAQSPLEAAGIPTREAY